MQVSSFREFKDIVAKNPQVQQDLQEDPVKTIQQFTDTSAVPDNWIYRMVVGSLGLVVVIITIGVVWRVASGQNVEDKNIPTILTALGSAAVGALAGLLAPSPTRQTAQ